MAETTTNTTNLAADVTLEDWQNWAVRADEWRRLHPLQIIQWEATRICNYNCVHCGSPKENYTRRDELTADEMLGALEQIAIDFGNPQQIAIGMTGGEPLLRKDIVEIIRGARKMGYNSFGIQTNGAPLVENPDLLDELIDAGVGAIGTNIDGCRESHDYFRGVPGSFDKICQLVKRLNSFEGLKTTVTTVFSGHNINEMEKIRDIVNELQPGNWRLVPMIPIGRGYMNKNALLTPDDYLRLVNFIKDQYINNKNVRVALGCGDWMGFDFEGQVRPYIWRCMAGVSVLGILYDGGIAGCSNIERSYIQGNVRTDRIKDIWENRYQKFRDTSLHKNGDCVDCDQWEYCKGGPMHNRLPDGQMSHCVYKIIAEGKDYFAELSREILEMDSGN